MSQNTLSSIWRSLGVMRGRRGRIEGGCGRSEKEEKMRKMIILTVVGIAILIGCKSYLSYDRQSTSDVPFDKRKPLSLDKAIIISSQGPQLEPKYYEIMGKVRSQANNLTILQNHCKDAIELLRYEAENVGADALINVSCSPDNYSAGASGTAITFRDREQALKCLKDMKAILE